MKIKRTDNNEVMAYFGFDEVEDRYNVDLNKIRNPWEMQTFVTQNMTQIIHDISEEINQDFNMSVIPVFVYVNIKENGDKELICNLYGVSLGDDYVSDSDDEKGEKEIKYNDNSTFRDIALFFNNINETSKFVKTANMRLLSSNNTLGAELYKYNNKIVLLIHGFMSDYNKDCFYELASGYCRQQPIQDMKLFVGRLNEYGDLIIDDADQLLNQWIK